MYASPRERDIQERNQETRQETDKKEKDGERQEPFEGKKKKKR